MLFDSRRSSYTSPFLRYILQTGEDSVGYSTIDSVSELLTLPVQVVKAVPAPVCGGIQAALSYF